MYSNTFYNKFAFSAINIYQRIYCTKQFTIYLIPLVVILFLPFTSSYWCVSLFTKLLCESKKL